jgi:hypothetical protein
LTYLLSQLNEAELEVDSEKATYKKKLEVLQEQEELIEDEAEQEEVCKVFLLTTPSYLSTERRGCPARAKRG